MALTPEQKGEELIQDFYKVCVNGRSATYSAIVCVEEILKECKRLGTADYRIPFWQSVLSYLKNK